MGTLVDPANSMKITIKDAFGTSAVSSQDMSHDTPAVDGVYHYNWDSRSITVGGIYNVTYVANDSGIYSYGEDIFYLGT